MNTRAHSVRNPVRAAAAWLGWTRDDYMSALAWAPLVGAFAAGVYLSYGSLVLLAQQLGYGGATAAAYPVAIDALVAACYVGQWRLAGLPGFHSRRLYLVALGMVAASFTMAGNGLHGAITWHLLSDPFPLPLLIAGSTVPAIAMIGAGHAVSIVIAADRARREQAPARPATVRPPDPPATARARPGPRTPAPVAALPPARGGIDVVRELLADAHRTGRAFDVDDAAHQAGLHPQRVRAIRREWQRERDAANTHGPGLAVVPDDERQA